MAEPSSDDDTEPSAEALKAAADALPITWGKQLVRDVALALDRFRAEGVEAERMKWESATRTAEHVAGFSPRYNEDERAAIRHCMRVLRGEL